MSTERLYKIPALHPYQLSTPPESPEPKSAMGKGIISISFKTILLVPSTVPGTKKGINTCLPKAIGAHALTHGFISLFSKPLDATAADLAQECPFSIAASPCPPPLGVHNRTCSIRSWDFGTEALETMLIGALLETQGRTVGPFLRSSKQNI